MEIYVKEENGVLKEITLRDLLAKAMEKSNFNVEVAGFGDKSASWILLTKEEKDYQISLEFSFNFKGSEFETISVWKTPFMLDEDKSEKLY